MKEKKEITPEALEELRLAKIAYDTYWAEQDARIAKINELKGQAYNYGFTEGTTTE